MRYHCLRMPARSPPAIREGDHEAMAEGAKKRRAARTKRTICQTEQQHAQNGAAQPIEIIGAGEGNRTLVISLEGCWISNYSEANPENRFERLTN